MVLFDFKLMSHLSVVPIGCEHVLATELNVSWLDLQNCLVRWEGSVCSAIVGDFGLAEKIPDYR